MFSARTSWQRHPNRLTRILDSRRKDGLPVYDLTKSNPTECGFHYPEKAIRDAVSRSDMLRYQPDPRGLLSARNAIAEMELRRGVRISPDNIFLTASTSEAYSILFRLLCNPGESVLVPKPSYPLFDYLTRVNDVTLQFYQLRYDGEWHVDFDTLKRALSPASRALIIVHPHNPTGMLISRGEYAEIRRFALRHRLILIVDEVFSEYLFNDSPDFVRSADPEGDVLTFTLDGISKMYGLPQMKLGWMLVSGPSSPVNEAAGRLEILLDTYLSVNTPVQAALPDLVTVGATIRDSIRDRVRSNYRSLKELIQKDCPVSLLNGSGGWYAILQVPVIKTDEEWSIELLQNRGILLYPGYFFEFEGGAYLLVSLIVEPELLGSGAAGVIDYIRQYC